MDTSVFVDSGEILMTSRHHVQNDKKIVHISFSLLLLIFSDSGLPCYGLPFQAFLNYPLPTFPNINFPII